METLSETYADFIVKTHYEQLGYDVVTHTKKLVLDLIGVSLAGYKLMEFPKILSNYLQNLGGEPEATIIQAKKKYPAINAALVNAVCAHSIDMDDGHRFAALHPGAVVIPTALAATELSEATTKEMITGIVVGYEIMIHLGWAINPSSLNRGFHTTGIIGPFAAAATAANIMKLNYEETIGALGLAGLQGAGLLQVNHDEEGAKVKPISPGRAAQAGLLSCILSRKGMRGPLRIFEGEDGFLKAVTDEVKTEILIKNLGKKFEIINTYIKFYAACRHAHAPIDAVLEIMKDSKIDPLEINKISVETYPVAIRLAGITHVTTTSAARFSIPFSVALAIIKGDAGADKYTEENVRDENIQKLSGKVELNIGGKWEELYPQKRGAKVHIKDNIGREWSAEVELAKGEPENPASWEEVYNKYYKNSKLLISEEDVKIIGKIIEKLENYPLDELTVFL
ncbi:MAG: MmgE/PrpD family protein [Methanomassiliicoccales archaeon]